MSPDVTLHNPVDVDDVCAVSRCDLLQSEAGCRAQPAYGSDIGFREPRRSVSTPYGPGAMARFVGVVLGDSRPAKVTRTVVVAAAVPVRDNVLRRWARTVKRQTYGDMHGACVALPQCNLEIPALLGLAENYTWERVFPFDAVDECAVYGSHATTVRSLVSWMSRYLAPLFSFPSHAAVLQQGAT